MTGLTSHLPLPDEGALPVFAGATAWLNSEPLTPAGLSGKVVAVDFWTYTCINWLRTLPFIRGWAETYGSAGLVMIGVHTPEFEVEHDIDGVRRAVAEMGIEYAVAVDNDYAVWNAFENSYWPALYIADAHGRIRHHHYGERGEERSEEVMRRLLVDAGAQDLPEHAKIAPQGIEHAADWHHLQSTETYVGARQSRGFASPERVAIDEPTSYTIPTHLHANHWALGGRWTVGEQAAVSDDASCRIAYRFHARDLHLILVPPAGGPARFRVQLDGRAPGAAHGLDVDEDGNGVVTEPRLHQLIRQSEHITSRRFDIEFLDAGVAALCFTFG